MTTLRDITINVLKQHEFDFSYLEKCITILDDGSIKIHNVVNKDLRAWRPVNPVEGFAKPFDTIPVRIQNSEIPLDFSNSPLSSFHNLPTVLNNGLDVSRTKIKNLDGSPKRIMGNFDISHTDIRSLVNGPEYVGGTYCIANAPLESIDGFTVIKDELILVNNRNIKSLKNIHEHIEFEKPGGVITFNYNYFYIKSHILGLLRIKNLGTINFQVSDDRFKEVALIIQKNMENKNRRAGLLTCQKELIEAGYEDYAKI